MRSLREEFPEFAKLLKQREADRTARRDEHKRQVREKAQSLTKVVKLSQTKDAIRMRRLRREYRSGEAIHDAYGATV